MSQSTLSGCSARGSVHTAAHLLERLAELGVWFDLGYTSSTHNTCVSNATFFMGCYIGFSLIHNEFPLPWPPKYYYVQFTYDQRQANYPALTPWSKCNHLDRHHFLFSSTCLGISFFSIIMLNCSIVLFYLVAPLRSVQLGAPLAVITVAPLAQRRSVQFNYNSFSTTHVLPTLCLGSLTV